MKYAMLANIARVTKSLLSPNEGPELGSEVAPSNGKS